jgi:hypothetical protein
MLLDDIRNIKSTRKDLRNFGLTVGGALAIVGGVLWWFAKPVFPYFMGAGALLVFLGLTVPAVLKPLQKIWMTFAVMMGWLMTRVILFFFFFLVFTSVGVFGRLFGKQFLSLRGKPGTSSQWNRREAAPYDKQKTEMQF